MTGKFRGVDEAPPVRAAVERPRRSTLETFNDELSVLERPLDGDLEYYDEAPPRPPRWRRVGAFVVAAALTAGGSLVVLRHFPPKSAVAQPSSPVGHPAAQAAIGPAPVAPLPTVAKSVAAKPEVAVAEAPPEAPAGAEAEAEVGAAADRAPSQHGPVNPAAWVKAGHHAGHARHSHHHKRHR